MDIRFDISVRIAIHLASESVSVTGPVGTPSVGHCPDEPIRRVVAGCVPRPGARRRDARGIDRSTHPESSRPPRGQTTQDFVVGISVFLLTVGFVFAFIPSAIGPGVVATDGAEIATADRVATEIVANASIPGYANRVDNSTLDTVFTTGSMGTLRSEYAISNATLANVTLEYANGTAISGRDTAAGVHYTDQQAAVVTRLLVVDDVRYRLVVRVW